MNWFWGSRWLVCSSTTYFLHGSIAIDLGRSFVFDPERKKKKILLLLFLYIYICYEDHRVLCDLLEVRHRKEPRTSNRFIEWPLQKSLLMTDNNFVRYIFSGWQRERVGPSSKREKLNAGFQVTRDLRYDLDIYAWLWCVLLLPTARKKNRNESVSVW